MWGKEVVSDFVCALGVGVELGRALCFGLCYGVLCGIWAVLRILFCALGFGVVLGGALVLDCIRNFGVGLADTLPATAETPSEPPPGAPCP